MKDYCPTDVVTPTWRPAYSIQRPDRPMTCRACDGEILMRHGYWWCCKECPPICSRCYAPNDGG